MLSSVDTYITAPASDPGVLLNSVVRSGKASEAVIAARALLDAFYRGVAGQRPVSMMCGWKLGDAIGVFSPECVH